MLDALESARYVFFGAIRPIGVSACAALSRPAAGCASLRFDLSVYVRVWDLTACRKMKWATLRIKFRYLRIFFRHLRKIFRIFENPHIRFLLRRSKARAFDFRIQRTTDLISSVFDLRFKTSNLSETSTYRRRGQSGRTARRRGGVGQDLQPTEKIALTISAFVRSKASNQCRLNGFLARTVEMLW